MSLHDERSRRQVIIALGAVAGSLTGCTGADGVEHTTGKATTVSTTSKEAVTDTSTAPAGTCDGPTTTASETHRYFLGEWHEETRDVAPGWRFAVTDLELATTFTLDYPEQSYDTPDDTQLAFVTTAVAHPDSSSRKWHGSDSFVLLLKDGTTYTPQRRFEDLVFAKVISVSQFQRVEHSGQYSTHGYTVPAGETRRLWWVFALPRSISRGDVEIAFDGAVEGPPPDTLQSSYPVRWVPEQSC